MKNTITAILLSLFSIIAQGSECITNEQAADILVQEMTTKQFSLYTNKSNLEEASGLENFKATMRVPEGSLKRYESFYFVDLYVDVDLALQLKEKIREEFLTLFNKGARAFDDYRGPTIELFGSKSMNLTSITVTCGGRIEFGDEYMGPL
jgi:hypothetical protein